jgi:hypothetical protein
MRGREKEKTLFPFLALETSSFQRNPPWKPKKSNPQGKTKRQPNASRDAMDGPVQSMSMASGTRSPGGTVAVR